MTTETVLTPEQIDEIMCGPADVNYVLGSPAERFRLFARAIEQAVLQSLPYQNSFSIRGDSYAGVYVWVGNENLVQHIPKVLAQTANDPQSMLGAVAAKCIQELKRFSELQSPEFQALRKDAGRYRWMRDPCSGAERVVYYSRGDFGKGLQSGLALDAAIDAAMEQQK